MEKERNILETGLYEIDGPSNGEIKLETIVLASDNGAKRIWKVKEMNAKEIILEIVKFA